MTREEKLDKAIGCIEYFVSAYAWTSDEAEALGYALELLKEQKPIEPTCNIDTWICSKCGQPLESQELIDDKINPQVLIHELYQYCPNCGKAVKWDAVI